MFAYHNSNPKLHIINLNLEHEQSFSQNKQALISKTVNVPSLKLNSYFSFLFPGLKPFIQFIIFIFFLRDTPQRVSH
jgi:hypothetical protein